MFDKAEFYAAAGSITALPAETGLEVAFVGRSNSGKSSAINAITGRKRLAHVSRTPGRTREIILFSVGDRAMLVDLPGYGYAKVPGLMKERWSALVSEYLLSRQQLVGLVMVVDCRHPLTGLDRQLLQWLRPSGKPLHVLLTKSDKLSRRDAAESLALAVRAIEALQFDATVQLFSSATREGVEPAVHRIAEWLDFAIPALRVGRIKKTPG